MGFPGQPFEGRWRLIDTSTAPTEQQFAGLKAVGPYLPIASRRDRHLIKGIETGLGFKLAFEHHTPLFKEQDVRLTVLEQFSSKVKHVLFASEFRAPASEGVAIVDGHPVGHVIVFVG